ncbi:MAG: DUF4229 domain-containing protein [Jatrophihabitans sp.]
MEETAAGAQAQEPQFGKWMGSMWLYSLLRFGMFFALWGILLLTGLEMLFAALLALVLSVPLSLVLLSKPRRAFTAQLELRVDAQRARKAEIADQLDPEDHDSE